MTPAGPPAACSVVELRRYRLHPGRRDELIALFDRELVETQEAVGMRVIGQFRDPGAPDDFVWLRGFADMAARKAALAGFYGGPVWRAHGSAANATMVSSDDVLLLRPADGAAWSPPAGERPPATAAGDGAGAVLVTIWPLGAASPRDLGTPLVTLVTERSPNTFPALPVREGESVEIALTAVPDAAAPVPDGSTRLIPTVRSLLHG
jgi:quinol monooxygenase YgiN